jgi:tRNA G18 (ribose-2'-O)-methylase SpoU
MTRGFFGIGIERTKTEHNVGTLWRTADLLGAAFMFTIGRRYKPRQASDTMHSSRHIPLYHYDSVADLKAHLPHSCKLVGVELDDRAVDLAAYSHPERACYMLGAEDHGLTRDSIEQCHDLIRLPGRFSMNVAVAGSIVAYDRVTRALMSHRKAA